MTVQAHQSAHNPAFWRLSYEDRYWRAETSQFSTELDLPHELAWRVFTYAVSRKGTKPSLQTQQRIIAALQVEIDKLFAR